MSDDYTLVMDDVEYSSEYVNISKLSFPVTYVGKVQYQESGVNSELYEFSFDGKSLSYKDGTIFGTELFVSINLNLNDREVKNYGAKILARKSNAEVLFPIGRASLLRR